MNDHHDVPIVLELVGHPRKQRPRDLLLLRLLERLVVRVVFPFGKAARAVGDGAVAPHAGRDGVGGDGEGLQAGGGWLAEGGAVDGLAHDEDAAGVREEDVRDGRIALRVDGRLAELLIRWR